MMMQNNTNAQEEVQGQGGQRGGGGGEGPRSSTNEAMVEDWEAVEHEETEGRLQQEQQLQQPQEEEEEQQEEGAGSRQQQAQPQNDDNDDVDYERLEEQYELCPRDPSRMELTPQEIGWAKAIKEAVENSDEIDNMTDFMYVQYALIDQDNIQAALDRAQHFQIFRQEYNLRDTVQEGKVICQQFVQDLLPKLMLSMSYNREEGNYVLVMDIAAFRESALRNENDYNTLLGFVYNVGHFLSPDFKAIRQGTCFVIECDGYDWKNLTMRTRRRLWTESLAVYPYKIQQIKYFHTGTYANLAAALMKRFLPPRIYSKLQVGCQFSGRLDTFYAVPNRQIANQRFIQRIHTCLERRYENIANFSLP